MAQEIERKFLVKNDAWKDGVHSKEHLSQGYISYGDGATVRVRIAGAKAFLTVKGKAKGLVRSEFEYPVPVADAEAMLAELVGGMVVSKIRHIVPYAGKNWELDLFSDENAGLVMAEIELDDPAEKVELPPWLGREVSDDPRFTNGALSRRPWRQWEEDERHPFATD